MFVPSLDSRCINGPGTFENIKKWTETVYNRGSVLGFVINMLLLSDLPNEIGMLLFFLIYVSDLKAPTLTARDPKDF